MGCHLFATPPNLLGVATVFVVGVATVFVVGVANDVFCVLVGDGGDAANKKRYSMKERDLKVGGYIDDILIINLNSTSFL